LLIGGIQTGRAALPRYFSLGKTVAIVGKRPKTWRKRDEAQHFCCLPLAVGCSRIPITSAATANVELPRAGQSDAMDTRWNIQSLLGTASNDPPPFAGSGGPASCLLARPEAIGTPPICCPAAYVLGVVFRPRAFREVCLMCHSKARSGP